MRSFQEILRQFKTLEERSGPFIYPQMVKEIFHIPTGRAIFFLELASRAGHLKPMYNVRCPSCDRILGTFTYKYEIPEQIECDAEVGHIMFDKRKHKKFIEKVYSKNEQR